MASEEAEDDPSEDSEAPAFRTIFIFVPPQGFPQGWSLASSRFAEALGLRHPGAATHRWNGGGTGEALSFAFTPVGGGEAEGTVGIDPNGVAIKDCTVTDAVEFAQWLMREVIPSDAQVHANIRQGVELDLPPVELPRGDAVKTERILADRVADILEFEAALRGLPPSGGTTGGTTGG